ncbi:MAG: hypothetical protein Q9207_000760 [Kuettlingeria erythrocarpa]
MGSSAKKKKEKKKDFQKPKFKVGKARTKPTNLTDTSFKSKAIVLNQQSLATTPPSATSQFSHHLSLLASHTDSQRKDSLSYITSAISTRAADAPLQRPVSVLLPMVLGLTSDRSRGVRIQLLKLLRALPASDLEDHAGQFLLHVRAGITHLAADVRSSTLDMLTWALDLCGDALVAYPGGWVKTLKSLVAIQGWPLKDAPSAWSSRDASLGNPGSGGKAMVKGLNALASFLRIGFEDPSEQDNKDSNSCGWPLKNTGAHMVSKKADCFAHLSLFGPSRDEDSLAYGDKEDRQRVFQERLRGPIQRGLEATTQQGGEIGRAAAGVRKAITEGMNGFDVVE